MKILAIDATTSFLSIAVLDGAKVLYEFHEEIGRNQSPMLVPEIDKALKTTKTPLRKLGCIAVSIGPGSFAGLRISVAAVKAMAIAAEVKTVAVPTLDSIAMNYTGGQNMIAPILDARKDKVYCAFYARGKGGLRRSSGYLLTEPEGLVKYIKKPTVFIGDGVNPYKGKLSGMSAEAVFDESIDWHPRARNVGLLALELAKKNKFTRIDRLLPMYLHPKECNVRMSVKP